MKKNAIAEIRKLLAAVLTLAVVTAPVIATPAAADAIMVQQMQEDYRTVVARGFQTVETFTGTLERRRGTQRLVTLEAGVTYVITAVCDTDCDRVRLRLFDQNNNLIEDARHGDRPMVSVVPSWTGPFRIRIDMTACTTSVCDYAIAVFAR